MPPIQLRLKPAALLLALTFSSFSSNLLADDLQQLRAELQQLKAAYEQRIAALEAKLSAAQGPKTVIAPEKTAPETPSTVKNQGFNPEVSLILQGQYRHKKDVAERGITGFWPATAHQHDSTSIPDANKRGFSVDHTELILAANIDPYWRGQAIIAALNGETEIEEAWFQSLGLGSGMGLKAGRFRSGIGYLNEQHPHMWDFANAPLMYNALFGDHGSYAQDGVQLKWLAPTPMFLEFGAEFGRGQNFPGSEKNKQGNGASALFAHIGDDVGSSHHWRAGISHLRTRPSGRQAHFEDNNGDEAIGSFSGLSKTWLADFVWKWAPDGNPKQRNFKFQAEYFDREEGGLWRCADGTTASACTANGTDLGDYRTRQKGWYAQGVYQFTPNWRAGLRHEQLNSGRIQIDEATVSTVLDLGNHSLTRYKPKRSSAMVDYSWSEFSRVRLQYAEDKSMLGITDHQVTLQYIMSLGTHGAHKF